MDELLYHNIRKTMKGISLCLVRSGINLSVFPAKLTEDIQEELYKMQTRSIKTQNKILLNLLGDPDEKNIKNQ